VRTLAVDACVMTHIEHRHVVIAVAAAKGPGHRHEQLLIGTPRAIAWLRRSQERISPEGVVSAER